jgi:signal transduction histidine kinase
VKSKYFLVLFLVAIPPVFMLWGVYYYFLLNPLGAPAAATSSAAVQSKLQAVQAQLQSVASAFYSAVQKINSDLPNLTAHNSDADLSAFVSSHPGVAGVFQVSAAGQIQKMVPPSPPLADANYVASGGFKNLQEKFKTPGAAPSQSYIQRLSYPAFAFDIGMPDQSIMEVIFNLETFFQGLNLQGGEAFLLEPNSGRYLFHSNKAKLSEAFNAAQEPWLSQVQADLKAQKAGSAVNSSQTAVVYAPSNISSIGFVQMFPAGGGPSQATAPAFSLDNLPQLLQTPMSLALLVVLGYILLVGNFAFGMILSPLRKAQALISNAAKKNNLIPPEQVRGFGKDEVGQVVQAAAMLLDNLQKERDNLNQEKEEALRRAKTEVEGKNREAAAAQQQVQSVKNELSEKNQQFNDKLKELDAMKGMTEGLRNQNEQAKAESSKLKGQVSTMEQAQADFQKKITDAQGQLKEMEGKLLQAVSQSSTIQVSQVRVSAIKTMAEELKTTLGIIKGYVSSALGTAQGGINEKQQEFLGMVINRSARLEKFINDLVDIYQVEIEQKEAKMEEVNLAAEIEGVIFNFQAQAEVKNIKLNVDAKPGLPKIPIVRKRFNQLWNILCLQTIKDAPRGSTIVITVELLGENIKVSVHDPGLTVTPETLPKLFDEFYDPKHPGSTQLAGTGLKFALVKTILAAHGGGAVAEKADPGTKLILSFPTKIRKTEALVPAAPAPAVAAPRPPAPPLGTVPASPATTAAGVKPPSLTPPGVGTVRPVMPTIPGGVPGPPKPAGIPGPPGMPPPAPKPPGVPAPGLLDSLISKSAPPSPGIPPTAAPPLGLPKPPLPAPSPMAPKPLTPSMPGTPKPPVPASSGLLDALINNKPVPSPGFPVGAPSAPPVPGAPPRPPGVPIGGPPSPGMLGVPPKPATPSPSAPSPGAIPKPPIGGGIEALLGKAIPPLNSPGLRPPGAAPPPGIPGSTAPRPPVPGAPPPMGGPPKVVPTSLKPTTPPPGILNLENADSFKMDSSAPPPPRPPSPPFGVAPRPIGAPPGMPTIPAPPPGGKSIVKNLDKDSSEGELIQ